jgi:CubicO group peptidase (beta-lactamase class C family)
MNTRIAFSLVAVFAAGLAVSCDSRASLTRSRIKAVEKGLVRARFLKGAKPEAFGLRERMAFYQVPAVSIAVVDGFRLEWARAYGMKAAGSSDPATPETLFQAGALGQAPAAAAALRLVEQGRLDLEADVNASLRGWRVPRTGSPGRGPVTLAALLSHSAGFEPVDLAGIPQGSAGPNLDQVLSGTPPAKNAPLRPSAEPGSRDLFSEAGFAALEKLLIDVGGRPFPALMKETVLDPAGMSESTYESPLSEAWRVRAAAGHRGDGRPVEGGWFDYPARAAKGLWATPTDLAVFGAAVMEAAAGKPSSLLGPAAARAMLTPRVGVRSLGFVVEGETRERLLVSLQGRTDGFASMLVMVPDKRQAAVVMANGDNGEPLIDEILRALSAAYGWAYFKPEEKPLYRLDPSVSGSYVGRYRLGSGAVLEVSAEDPFLVLTSAGRPPIKLYVDGETVFFSIDPPLRVRFQKDGSGRVDRLVLIQGRSLQEAVRSE